MSAPQQPASLGTVWRAVSVIDAYDAMISNRCYRKGLPHAGAIHCLLKGADTRFDREVVEALIPIAELRAGEVLEAAGTSASAAL